MTLIKQTKIMLAALLTLAASFAYAAPSADPAPGCTPIAEVEAAVVAKQGATAEYDVKNIAEFLKRLHGIPLTQDFWEAVDDVDRVIGYGKAGFPAIKVFYFKKGCVVAGAYSDRSTMDQLTAPAGEKI